MLKLIGVLGVGLAMSGCVGVSIQFEEYVEPVGLCYADRYGHEVRGMSNVNMIAVDVDGTVEFFPRDKARTCRGVGL